MTSASADVVVIGAGVSGLSTALALLDAGAGVTVFAAQPPQRTTSAAAGALWGPHLVGADDRVARWAAVTLDRLRALAGDQAAGVRETSGLVALAGSHKEPPAFTSGTGELAACDPASLPAGYACGWRYSAPVVTMPAYLDYLTDQVLGRGGQLHLGQPLRSLADAARRWPATVLVNCAGIGARDLVPDPGLIPVRGQAVVVANPGLTGFFIGEGEAGELTYFFPHGPTAVLGGTQDSGADDLRPDPATAAQIIARCAGVEPRLADAPVLAHRVGLRPVRPSVRLEAETAGSGDCVIHNYGHGGAGVTLSWGCALAVADEVLALARR